MLPSFILSLSAFIGILIAHFKGNEIKEFVITHLPKKKEKEDKKSKINKNKKRK